MKFTTWCSNERGGGSKAFWTMLKKLHFSYGMASLIGIVVTNMKQVSCQKQSNNQCQNDRSSCIVNLRAHRTQMVFCECLSGLTFSFIPKCMFAFHSLRWTLMPALLSHITNLYESGKRKNAVDYCNSCQWNSKFICFEKKLNNKKNEKNSTYTI